MTGQPPLLIKEYDCGVCDSPGEVEIYSVWDLSTEPGHGSGVVADDMEFFSGHCSHKLKDCTYKEIDSLSEYLGDLRDDLEE